MNQEADKKDVVVKGDPVLGAMMDIWLRIMGYVCGYRVLDSGEAVRDLTKKQGAEILLGVEIALNRHWPEPLRRQLLEWNEGELDLEGFEKYYTRELKGLGKINPEALKGLTRAKMEPAMVEEPEPVPVDVDGDAGGLFVS